MGLLSAAVGGAISAIGNIAGGLINRSMSRSNAKWNAALDWKYLQKAKDLDWYYDSTKYFDLDKQYYNWEAKQQYDYARKYAENSSKWQVQGLRNAGLNPILAATDGNFRGTFGDPVSMGGHARSSGSAGSIRSQRLNSDIASNLGSSILQGSRLQAETSNITQSTETSRTQSELNSANADKAKADTELLQAQKAKTLVDTANSAKNQGYTSFGSQLLNSAKSTLGSLSLLNKWASSKSKEMQARINLRTTRQLNQDYIDQYPEVWSKDLEERGYKKPFGAVDLPLPRYRRTHHGTR